MPLWYLILPFVIVSLFALLFLFFNIFHLKRYAITGWKTEALIGLYVVGFLIIFGIGAAILSSYDWFLVVDAADLLPAMFNGGASQYGL
jgi:hypothetical protein